jgi:hypothetical protein
MTSATQNNITGVILLCRFGNAVLVLTSGRAQRSKPETIAHSLPQLR